MDKIIAFLSLAALIVAGGGTSSNSTHMCFEKKQVEMNEQKDTARERSHTLTRDFWDVDNKGSGWGFVKKKGEEPEIYKSTQDIFAAYNTYYVDPARTRTIYLTFDEGYENGYTASILDTLKKCDVPAAFFVTGPYLEKETELVDRMVAEGHIVGNHTVHHPNMHKLSDPQKMADELEALNHMFFEKYGKNMEYMRPPEGEYSTRVLAVANDLGYKTVFWSFAYKDWDVNVQRGAGYAFSQVTPYLHNGAILLLHAVSKDNAESLEDIINYAKESGYRFASLDELKNN